MIHERTRVNPPGAANKSGTSWHAWLVGRVSERLRVEALLRRFELFLLVFGGLYAALLAATRLLALVPLELSPLTVAIVPAAALGLAVVVYRRPRPPDVGRIIDLRMDTGDLFLTAALLEGALGEFKPLVQRQAEQRASFIRPERVVPWRLARPARTLGAVLAVLAASVLFLPRLDPFRREEARRRMAARRAKIEQERKAVQVRLEALDRRKPDAEHSKAVEQSLAALEKAFQSMKPGEPAKNAEKLAGAQKDLGDLWKKVNEEKLKDVLNRDPGEPALGGLDRAKAGEWKDELSKGDTKGLRKEMGELSGEIKKMESLPEGAEKRELREELARRLEALRDFVERDAGSGALGEALSRALDQLEMAEMEGLSQDALEALEESLDLAEEELESLAQSARDLQSLEQALRTLQLARRANEQQNGLDGQAVPGTKGLEAYERLYAQLCQEGGEEGGAQAQNQPNQNPANPQNPRQNPQGGQNGPGIGQGTPAQENDAAQTDFKTEQAKSALTAGRILMQWKTNEAAEKGVAREDYIRVLKDVQQGAQEAILKEQVPPAYRESIQRYFDTLQEAAGKPPAETP